MEKAGLHPVLTDYKEGFLAGAMRYQREMEMPEGINILS